MEFSEIYGTFDDFLQELADNDEFPGDATRWGDLSDNEDDDYLPDLSHWQIGASETCTREDPCVCRIKIEELIAADLIYYKLPMEVRARMATTCRDLARRARQDQALWEHRDEATGRNTTRLFKTGGLSRPRNHWACIEIHSSLRHDEESGAQQVSNLRIANGNPVLRGGTELENGIEGGCAFTSSGFMLGSSRTILGDERMPRDSACTHDDLFFPGLYSQDNLPQKGQHSHSHSRGSICPHVEVLQDLAEQWQKKHWCARWKRGLQKNSYWKFAVC